MSGKIRLEKVFETLGSRLVQTTPRFHAASVVMATPGDAIGLHPWLEFFGTRFSSRFLPQPNCPSLGFRVSA